MSSYNANKKRSSPPQQLTTRKVPRLEDTSTGSVSTTTMVEKKLEPGKIDTSTTSGSGSSEDRAKYWESQEALHPAQFFVAAVKADTPNKGRKFVRYFDENGDAQFFKFIDDPEVAFHMLKKLGQDTLTIKQEVVELAAAVNKLASGLVELQSRVTPRSKAKVNPNE